MPYCDTERYTAPNKKSTKQEKTCNSKANFGEKDSRRFEALMAIHRATKSPQRLLAECLIRLVIRSPSSSDFISTLGSPRIRPRFVIYWPVSVFSAPPRSMGLSNA